VENLEKLQVRAIQGNVVRAAEETSDVSEKTGIFALLKEKKQVQKKGASFPFEKVGRKDHWWF